MPRESRILSTLSDLSAQERALLDLVQEDIEGAINALFTEQEPHIAITSVGVGHLEIRQIVPDVTYDLFIEPRRQTKGVSKITPLAPR